MSRLIDINAVIRMLNTMDRYTSTELTLCDTDKTFPKNEVFVVDDVYEGLDELSPAEPEGKWIVTSEFSDCCYAKCNQCNVTQIFYYGKPLTNYCPNCGADMRRGDLS